jgi:lysophospholipase L1-like esterase
MKKILAGRPRGASAVLAALLGALLWLPLQPGARGAEPVAKAGSPRWVATWGTAPAGPALAKDIQAYRDQTLRLIVHTSIGGKAVRVKLSNELGSVPLRIGSARVALRKSGAGTVPGTDRELRFGGLASVSVAPGAPVLSDPVDLDVPAMSDLAVSVYLPGEVQATTNHAWTPQTSYVSGTGDFTKSAELPVERTITSWPFLTGVDVDAPRAVAVVALGDSITEASNTVVDANHRWTDLLAERLRASDARKHLAVVNRGISGNRMLRDPGEQPLFGKSALARFDRDVLATAGVRYVVLLIGINDIGHPGTGAIPASETATPQEIIAGYRQLIERAHQKGIRVFASTLTPFEGTVFPRWYTAEKDALRAAVNEWIRTGGEFDGIIDFDKALRDPAHPARLLPAYDKGDHLHPNDLGMEAMAKAIPLELFAPAPGTRRQQQNHH